MKRVFFGAGIMAALLLLVGLVFKFTARPNHLLLLGGAVLLINMVCLPLMLVGWIRLGTRIGHTLIALFSAILVFLLTPALVVGRTLEDTRVMALAGVLLALLTVVILLTRRHPELSAIAQCNPLAR